jgi:hypothetical protein
MSGWKAIRTLNRDARVASGQSPYGYKARYSSNGRTNSTAELRWDVVSNGKRNEAVRIYKGAYNYLTTIERQDIDSLTQKSTEITELAEAELQLAQRSFFFRSSKVERWRTKWSTLLIEDAERFLTACQNMAIVAKSRSARFKKNEGSQSLFEDAIEAVFCEKDHIGDLKSRHDSAVRDILSEACRSGIILMKNGQYIVEYSDWEDVVIKHNSLRVIMIGSFSQLIRSNAQQLVKRGITLSCIEKSGQLTANGKTIKFQKLSL